MLYIIYGTDLLTTTTKTKNLVSSLLKKRPNVTLFRVADDTWSDSFFEELISGQTLFDKKYIVVASNILKNKTAVDFLVDFIDQISASPHIFILREEVLPESLKKKFLTTADKVLCFDLPKGKQQKFNVFSLGDSLGRRDRKSLWVLYQRALLSGVSPEEVFWQLYRTVKNMILVKSKQDLSLLKIHPYVIKKTEAMSDKFSPIELKNLLEELNVIYLDNRSGQKEMVIDLERFVLEV